MMRGLLLVLTVVIAACGGEACEPGTALDQNGMCRHCDAEFTECVLDAFYGCGPEDGFGPECRENEIETCRYLLALCQVDTATVVVRNY